jgi:hypothetical protein
VSNCGYLYTARGLSDVVRIGGCAASLSAEHVAEARIGVGDAFRIASVAQLDGTPEVQAPTSDHPDIVERTETSNRGGDAMYRALMPGTATLTTSTLFCDRGPIDATQPQHRICPVVRITVERAP